MKMIYTNQNNVLVELAKNLLTENSISTVLKNEFASAGAGELSAIDTWPELWVHHEADYQAAESLITTLQNQPEQEDWTCSSCDEKNGDAFEICWNCQHAKV
ncbi:MAG: DUF2007 domain-containing protein [Gammaproteobacteria bacterium]|nr:DUF2007 domain-containing protein [Gammaproteobacteria bacterium]